MTTTTRAMTEREALRADAKARAAELRAVARTLWRDRDDPEVLSELITVMGALRQAEASQAQQP